MIELMNAFTLLSADGMSGLVSTGMSVLTWAQRLAVVGSAISFCIGGYYLMWGGDRGRQKSMGWFIGGAVGLIVVMGALGLAAGVDSNIRF